MYSILRKTARLFSGRPRRAENEVHDRRLSLPVSERASLERGRGRSRRRRRRKTSHQKPASCNILNSASQSPRAPRAASLRPHDNHGALDLGHIVPRDRRDPKGRRVYDKVLIWAYKDANSCTTDEAIKALLDQKKIDPPPPPTYKIKWSATNNVKAQMNKGKGGSKKLWEITAGPSGIRRWKVSPGASWAGIGMPWNTKRTLSRRSSVNSDSRHPKRARGSKRGRSKTRHVTDRQKPPDAMARYLPHKGDCAMLSGRCSGDPQLQAQGRMTLTRGADRNAAERRHYPTPLPADPIAVVTKSTKSTARTSARKPTGRHNRKADSADTSDLIVSSPTPDSQLPPEPTPPERAILAIRSDAVQNKTRSSTNTQARSAVAVAASARKRSPVHWGDTRRTYVPYESQPSSSSLQLLLAPRRPPSPIAWGMWHGPMSLVAVSLRLSSCHW
ncbi:hypothetical protein BKA67DRAFT_249608 [Truncatella angustata]|uniref:Uncharacterized protein n=1 Tax=Truncatella angustata TaxID=152316 RepID=A0A9P8UP77_9PEZI|nr:uncharacterized protein BKA67DRAFT_249608 [Truncatella angustata]KAH6655785.1 hypothetical protein BKA67DRAFT_249608 [Truncatella angustata]